MFVLEFELLPEKYLQLIQQRELIIRAVHKLIKPSISFFRNRNDRFRSHPTSHPQKLCRSDLTTKYHPSTSTNNNILNGNEIITGGSIIIPIDISTLATTISITKKGIKIINPI